MKNFKSLIIFSILLVSIFSCKKEEIRIKLATTTSTDNSGLLEYLLPEFTKDTNITVDVIAVGTGKALALGENGDVDVVLVHARGLEDKFVENGYGINRKDVMYNDFVIVGDTSYSFEEAENINDVFKKIAGEKIPFVSRGDNSGTNVKELAIWQNADITPSGDWYKEVGQGMEQTLWVCENIKGTTLTDRGTFLSVKDKINLKILFEGDDFLANPYGIIAVNPDKWTHVKFDAAMKLIDWITSDKGQNLINDFKANGEQLFFPHSK